MPTKAEKDSITGRNTTGHVWDGIKELDTPLPKWWLWVFYACILWSIGYWVLYPSFPWINGYLTGIYGYSQRAELEEQVAAAREAQSVYLDRIAEMTPAEILEDAELTTFALAGGAASFADNCAPCHGLGGSGNPGGFPVLADDDWLWGGTLEEIEYTIRHGIRNDDDFDARLSQMPEYGGEFGLLANDEIQHVADYVLSLSGGETEADAETLAAGAEIFGMQCAMCHGDNGGGMQMLGAPNLTDAIWLFGGDRTSVIQQISAPQHGVMPPWAPRLEGSTISMLTVYVHQLGGGQ